MSQNLNNPMKAETRRLINEAEALKRMCRQLEKPTTSLSGLGLSMEEATRAIESLQRAIAATGNKSKKRRLRKYISKIKKAL